MTKEEFDSLKPGDIVRNVNNNSIKSVLPAGFPVEPIVAISKDRMENHLGDWEIFARSIKPSPVPTSSDEPEKED